MDRDTLIDELLRYVEGTAIHRELKRYYDLLPKV